MDPNWSRWIKASIAQHFEDAISAFSTPLQMYLEGTPRDTDESKDFVEVRLNGPIWCGGSQDEWTCDPITVNVFIQSKEDQEDAYRLDKNIGLISTAFTTTIPILKLGDGPEDDGSLITCLNLKSSGKDTLRVIQFGQVTPSTQLLRAAVEGDYTGNFYG